MTSLSGKRFLPLLSLRSGATPFIDLNSALVLIYSMLVRSSICHEVYVQCRCDVWSVNWYTDFIALRTSPADFLTTRLKLFTCLGKNIRSTLGRLKQWIGRQCSCVWRGKEEWQNQRGVFKTARESHVFLQTVRGWGGGGAGWRGSMTVLTTPGLVTGSGWP